MFETAPTRVPGHSFLLRLSPGGPDVCVGAYAGAYAKPGDGAACWASCYRAVNLSV